MRVLGIDPGTRLTGYGCIDGSLTSLVAPRLVEAGVVRLVRGGQTPSLASRLAELERDIAELIELIKPDLIGIESMFTNPRHPGTVIPMAHARGVILLVAQRSGAELVEVPPAEVKRSIAGSGSAKKDQMQASVQRLLGLPGPPRPADVADALAVAICVLRRASTGRLESEANYDP
ncbi:MAG: crossover junction endodeoxyribonuclease RuvC [Planctomycetota bacterium]